MDRRTKRYTAEDAPLIRKAIKERWKIPHDVYAQLPKLATKWAEGEPVVVDGHPIPTIKTQHRINAGKLLATMHGQNLRAEAAPETQQVNINLQQVLVLVKEAVSHIANTGGGMKEIPPQIQHIQSNALSAGLDKGLDKSEIQDVPT